MTAGSGFVPVVDNHFVDGHQVLVHVRSNPSRSGTRR
jgi:hypothetical protein